MHQEHHRGQRLAVRFGARYLLSAVLLLTASTLAAAAQVNLFVTATRPVVPPGGQTVITVTVGNRGQPTTGAVQVAFATPPYVSFDRNAGLPAGCRFEYLNLDRTVPELVLCTVSVLGTGETRPLPFSVDVHPLAPAAGVAGLATILPAPASADVDAALENNFALPALSVGRTTIRSGQTNLFLTGDFPAIGGFRPTSHTFVVGNNGPAATTGPVTFSYAVPFFVNIDRTRPLPHGCVLLYENINPGVPELVQCQIPPLAAGASRTIALPLVRAAGPPFGTLPGIAAIRVEDAAGDADPDRNDNLLTTSVNSLTPILPALGSRASDDALSSVFPSASGSPADDTMDDAGPDAASAPSSTTLQTTSGARIDLTLGFTTLAIALGGVGTQTATVGNQGEDATGPVRLIYVTPRGVNIDRNQGLPLGCQFLYENLDPTIPEIVECILPGPRRDETISRTFGLAASNQTVPARLGIAVVMPAPTSADADQFVRDNVTHPLLALIGSAPTPPPGPRVDLYLSVTSPNLLVNRPGTGTITVGNKGPNATQGVTRVTLPTPLFVNVDRSRGLPASCSFLFENQDAIVPEIVECLIAAPLAPGAEVTFALPLALSPGGPSGTLFTSVFARPHTGSPDAEVSLIDNSLAFVVMASQRAPRTLRLYLHGADVPPTAGGFTMNETPTSGSLTVSLLRGVSWFSNPALAGTFDADATFTVVIPCTLGLGLGSTYILSITDVNGGSVRTLGETSRLASLCLGTQRVALPVLTPVTLDTERLKLTLTDLLNVSVRLPPGTHLEGTNFRGAP